MNSDSLLDDVARLFALLEERRVSYVLVGGVAMLQYVEGRNTEDLDLIMALSSLKSLPEIQVVQEEENFARARFHELKIDVLLTRNPLFEKVSRDYSGLRGFAEREIRCASVEGLLLLKLYALPSLYRQGNFARVGLYENDIATLIQAYRPALNQIIEELQSHLSDADLKSIQDILAEIHGRIERFGRKVNEKA